MSQQRSGISRRQLAKGTAWAVPAVVAAGAVPAFASSMTSLIGDSYVNFGTDYQSVTVTNQFGCAFTTTAPEIVTNITAMVWLPCPSLTFGANTGAGTWTTLTRWNGTGSAPIPGATSTITAPTTSCTMSTGTYTQTGCTYYAYYTTWLAGPAGKVTCGGKYSFEAIGGTSSCTCHPTPPQSGHYYWLQAKVDGIVKTGGGLTSPRKINCP